MRVLVLGRTCFLGRRVVERLHARGDSVLVAHRGRSEPAPWIPVQHLHTAGPSYSDVPRHHSAPPAGFEPAA